MKKNILLLLFLIAGFSGFAQRFDGGVLLGFNGSQVKGDSYSGYNKPGLLAGLFIQTELSPAFFAGMELKYSQKGARKRMQSNTLQTTDYSIYTTEDPDVSAQEKYIMRLGYIDLPVYFGYRTNDLISIIGGASFGYLLHSAEFDNYGKFPPSAETEFKSFDLQAFAGLQLDIFENLKVDLRIAYSLLPIRDTPISAPYYWVGNQFNNVISLAVYYRLNMN